MGCLGDLQKKHPNCPFSSSRAARVGFRITGHLNRMRDHIRTALSLIRREGILRPYFGKASDDLITFLGAYQTHFKVLICKDREWLPQVEPKRWIRNKIL